MTATKITLTDIKIDDVYRIVKELRAQGLRQHQDFDFEYIPAMYDAEGWRCRSETRFTFYQEKLATMFTLRYAHENNRS